MLGQMFELRHRQYRKQVNRRVSNSVFLVKKVAEGDIKKAKNKVCWEIRLDISICARNWNKALVDAMVNENEQLIKEQEELKKKVEKGNEYLDQLAMIKRDFENYKRRTNAAKDNSKEEGKILVIERILPILDVFDRAKESLKGKPELEPFAMIERQFLKVLGEVGLEEIEVLNTEFDPSTSYAIAKAEAGEENKNKIIEVLSKGYKLGDKIVKYAQVKVGC